MGVWLIFTAGGRGAVSMVVGTYNATSTFDDQNPQRVEFGVTMDEVPLVFALTTNEGGDTALIRIFDVDEGGFSSLITEPESFDGQHVEMTNVSFIAVRPGEIVLPDGTVITAGSIDTADAIGGPSSFSSEGTWDSVDYANAYNNDPALLLGLQTINNTPGLTASGNPDPFLSVGVRNADETGFDVSLERLETGTGDPGAGIVSETIGWLAVEQGTGMFDLDGTDIFFDFGRADDAVDGWADGGENVSFAQNFTGTPVGVASMNSRNGNNGGLIRRGTLNSSGVQLYIDEDTSFDTERNHITEDVGWVFFSEGFVYDDAVPEPGVAGLVLVGLLAWSFARSRESR